MPNVVEEIVLGLFIIGQLTMWIYFILYGREE